MSILVSILILSFLVIIHELGHFLVARLFKIKVEEFGLGYPPRALHLFKKWGTVFTLNWIPFGGFVRMEGEDGPELEDLTAAESTKPAKKTQKPKPSPSQDGPFYSKSVPARLAVILAGAFVNFVFAMVAFSSVFSIAGLPSGAIISSTAEGSPARQAGVPAQVAIVRVSANNETYATRTSAEVQDVIRRHRGQSITLHTIGPCEQTSCQENPQDHTVYVRTEDETPDGQGSVGVAFSSDFYKFYTWYEMPLRGAAYGIEQALSTSIMIIQMLGSMLGNLIFKGIIPLDLKGPVGILGETHKNDLYSQGPLVWLYFSGMLSLNLAVMNVLPIPALDGGQAVFIILEKIIGRSRVDKVRNQANYGGFVVLLLLLLLITSRDIWNLIKGT